MAFRAVHVVSMKLVGRALIAILVLGVTVLVLMQAGTWNGVVAAIDDIFGTRTADRVEQFGEAAQGVRDGAVDHADTIHDHLSAGTPIDIDWGALGSLLDGVAAPTVQRIPSYDSDEYGDGWLDLDGDGCDTRNEILQRDLTAVVIDANGCTVLSGELDDPYTGTAISFQRGPATSIKVQIDHVIPKALAWRSGAWSWSDEQREAFANDPANLLAVDGPANGSKSDRGIGEWLPADATFHCEYTALYVSLIEKYELAMPDADKVKADELIGACQ